MDKRINENTQARKSNNLVLNGVPEKSGENCVETAVTYLRHIDPKLDKNQVVNAYRLGKSGGISNRHRTLLVKFKDVLVKEDIVKKKGILKNKKELSKFHCNEDLSDSARKVQQEMREIVRYALSIGYTNMKVTGNKIQWNDKIFYEDELYLLPLELQLANIKTRPVPGGIGFQSEHSYLSSFFPCTIRMHQSVFSSAEQAFQYHKSIICEREDIGLQLKELSNPTSIKQKGDRIPTCDNWERSKETVMKKIQLQKYIQNPELKAKLLGTVGSALLECTNSRYWGTGWFLDDEGWKGTAPYPGKNILGKIIEEIRDSFDTDVLNSTNVIQQLNVPTDLEVDMTRVQKINPAAPRPLARAEVQITPKPQPTAKEMSKSIIPTTLAEAESSDQIPKSQGPATIRASASASNSEPDGTEGTEESSENQDEIMEAENYDALSFTSSIFAEGNDRFDAKNVTLPNGRLNVEKLLSWSLPVVNLSRVLDRSMGRSSGTKDKIVRLMEAQRKTGQPSHSTPAAGNISMVGPKRKGRSKVALDSSGLAMSEKESIFKMLNDMNN